MKAIKYILFTISLLLVNKNIYADTCSYKEQTNLNNDLANIKITYEVINDNQINIMIYNVTENIYISYNQYDVEEETEVHYYNTNNGKYILTRDTKNLEEYRFVIRSNISSCYGNIISTKTLIKPKLNNYSNLEICKTKDLENHSYCQKYTQQEINKTESEVIKILQDFLDSKVKKSTTTVTSDEVNNNEKKIIITSSIIGIIIVGMIIVIILIKKKRSEL